VCDLTRNYLFFTCYQLNVEFVFAAGNLVVNPFNPNAQMQQWMVTERKIQNRRHPNIVLEVRDDSDKVSLCPYVTTGEYSGSDMQLWNISHVYV